MSHFANKEDLLQTIQTYFDKILAEFQNTKHVSVFEFLYRLNKV